MDPVNNCPDPTAVRPRSRRPVVLMFVPHYLPGYKAGGPTKSLSALVDALGDEYTFKIVTSDRDLGDDEPYADVPRDRWTPVAKADVLYISRGPLRGLRILQALRSIRCDLLYLNSFFDRPFSLWPLFLWRLGLVPVPLLLAPRGQFSPGALGIKRLRKAAYLAATQRLGFYTHVAFHVSTEFEGDDLIRTLARAITRYNAPPVTRPELPRLTHSSPWVAPDLGSALPSAPIIRGPQLEDKAPHKVPGLLRVVFVSRVARNKNLKFALECLTDVKGRVLFDIYGPLEDEKYWRECEMVVKCLPAHVSVTYHGPVPPAMVGKAFRTAHLFFFPTRGENFGHVVPEALAEGCPALISDETPWRGLEKASAGWVLPLAEPEGFRAALQHCIDLDAPDHERLVAGARAYAEVMIRRSKGVEQHRAMFSSVMQLTL